MIVFIVAIVAIYSLYLVGSRLICDLVRISYKLIKKLLLVYMPLHLFIIFLYPFDGRYIIYHQYPRI